MCIKSHLGSIFDRDIEVNDTVGCGQAAVTGLAPIQVETLRAGECNATVRVAVADLHTLKK